MEEKKMPSEREQLCGHWCWELKSVVPDGPVSLEKGRKAEGEDGLE